MRSIVRAVSVSSAIGVIARRAVARPASSASIVPPSTPSPRKKRTRLAVASTSLSRRAYCTNATPPSGSTFTRRDSTRKPANSSVGASGGERYGALGEAWMTALSSVTTRTTACCALA